MSNSDIQKKCYNGLLETDEINEDFIKEEFKKQHNIQWSNYKKKIYEATKKTI